MKNIPIAEEFFDSWCFEKGYSHIDECDDIEECMIEFAKLHVEEALKEALESIPCLGSSTDELLQIYKSQL